MVFLCVVFTFALNQQYNCHRHLDPKHVFCHQETFMMLWTLLTFKMFVTVKLLLKRNFVIAQLES